MSLLQHILGWFTGRKRAVAQAIDQDLQGQLLTELAVRHAERQSYLLNLAAQYERAGEKGVAANLREAADNLLAEDPGQSASPELDAQESTILSLPPLQQLPGLADGRGASKSETDNGQEGQSPEPPKRRRGRPRKTN